MTLTHEMSQSPIVDESPELVQKSRKRTITPALPQYSIK